ncbi:hypothetical protein COMA2_40106 [Candidatus Nitrospira nitrificans]|uniref:Uncharacterized protein n=1 Tax=Candidatus Nitrospira nitrificans TaxID=1742973 RepID=A0A0S4LK28_9BACT|nr:hypothetical protein COMA2_40106 [Candidatus Nitrospira nitrificans]
MTLSARACRFYLLGNLATKDTVRYELKHSVEPSEVTLKGPHPSHANREAIYDDFKSWSSVVRHDRIVAWTIHPASDE